ncbi:MAG: hypothetical protein EGP07_02505 [SAR202 cluster bacterium]|nr:MAG: hypothetical protein EGP07_02505 [SAR202 cluster bacterium]
MTQTLTRNAPQRRRVYVIYYDAQYRLITLGYCYSLTPIPSRDTRNIGTDKKTLKSGLKRPSGSDKVKV